MATTTPVAQYIRTLRRLCACDQAINWCKANNCETAQEAWDRCPESSWMTWAMINIAEYNSNSGPITYYSEEHRRVVGLCIPYLHEIMSRTIAFEKARGVNIEEDEYYSPIFAKVQETLTLLERFTKGKLTEGGENGWGIGHPASFVAGFNSFLVQEVSERQGRMFGTVGMRSEVDPVLKVALIQTLRTYTHRLDWVLGRETTGNCWINFSDIIYDFYELCERTFEENRLVELPRETYQERENVGTKKNKMCDEEACNFLRSILPSPPALKRRVGRLIEGAQVIEVSAIKVDEEPIPDGAYLDDENDEDENEDNEDNDSEHYEGE